MYYLCLSHLASQSHSWELLLIIRAHNLRTSSFTPLSTGLTLLCCPWEVNGLLSRVLWLLTGRDSSPALLTSGPCSPHCLWNWLPPTTTLRRAGSTPLLFSTIKIKFNFKKKFVTQWQNVMRQETSLLSSFLLATYCWVYDLILRGKILLQLTGCNSSSGKWG